MNTDRLRTAAGEIAARGRISFADVRRLQRDILPEGVACREEAEILIGLDRIVPRADRAWGEWFVAAMVDFVVWAERPTGIVDEDAARWLSGQLDEAPTRSGRALVRAILNEAERVHERLAPAADEQEGTATEVEMLAAEPLELAIAA